MGISLHFSVLWYLSVIFIIASLAAIPTFAICAAGSRLSDAELDPLSAAKVSIANFGSRFSMSNYTVTPWVGSPVSYRAQDASFVISMVDVAISLLIILFVLFIRQRINALAEEVDRNVVTTRDYAVFVRGLPRDATEDEVRAAGVPLPPCAHACPRAHAHTCTRAPPL
ncbi:hypothetical protein EON62_01070 [archaeon]|nr:MAG: hypothetical protein EON62_01070 [archaeon]